MNPQNLVMELTGLENQSKGFQAAGSSMLGVIIELVTREQVTELKGVGNTDYTDFGINAGK